MEGEFEALQGEDQQLYEPAQHAYFTPYEVPIVAKKFTFEEASQCLNTLGKDESGIRYAYLRISAIDRLLTDVSVILNFKHVLFVDLTGNLLNLEALQVLTEMPFLIWLQADRNRVESAALYSMPYLQVLSLNINKIEETCDIEQPLLETLDLAVNQIYSVQFDQAKLPKLKELSLKGNHLIDLSGSYPESLERLYVAQNNITRLNELSLAKLPNLTTLHLRGNKIRKLNGFTDYLSQLSYLNLRDNNIMKLRQFRKLSCLPKLEVLVYTDNPMEGKLPPPPLQGEGDNEEEDAEDEEEPGEGGAEKFGFDPTRIALLVLLPNLKKINKELINFQEREEAYLVKEKRLEQIMSELSSDDETEPPTTTYTSERGDVSETDNPDEDPRSDNEEFN